MSDLDFGQQLAELQRRTEELGRAISAPATGVSGNLTASHATVSQSAPVRRPPPVPVVHGTPSVASVAQPAIPFPVAVPTSEGDQPRAQTRWPDPLAEEAFYGLAGDVVRTIEPHTESDPVAILVQLLVGFGNVVGRSAHFTVEGDAHHANLFTVLVGPSSKARKGTSWGQVRRLFRAAEEPVAVEVIWERDLIQSGLSSGEGLIWGVRDSGGTGDNHDPGVSDKRLLAVEAEFSRALVSMKREGNVLSEVSRQSWDSGDLRILTKTSPAKATGAHISIIGHCTSADLRDHLSTTDQGNGFANRYLWICVRRSKMLPEGGNLTNEAITQLAERLRRAIAFGSTAGEMRRDDAARLLWRQEYPMLSQGKPGLLGSVTSRAEAQVLRISMIYALLDCSAVIRVEHLRAALALWRYCEDSARYVFGDAVGNPVADKILAALRESGPAGLTRTAIRDILGKHGKQDKINAALRSLEELGLARMRSHPTGGRAAECWFATGLAATEAT